LVLRCALCGVVYCSLRCDCCVFLWLLGGLGGFCVRLLNVPVVGVVLCVLWLLCVLVVLGGAGCGAV